MAIKHEGRGLCACLLADVISRTAQLGAGSAAAGWWYAEMPQARGFYLHLIPELEQSPTDDFRLTLLVKDILRTLRA